MKTLIICLVFYSTTIFANEPALFTILGRTMGTSYSVKMIGMPPIDFKSVIDLKLEQVNDQMSTYRENSELSRFNRAAANQWFPVSEETVKVAIEAQEISKKSKGAFDSTVGKLVNKWGFGPDGRATKIPTQDAINTQLQISGWNKVEVRENPPALKKSDAKLYVDFSGIAKGFGVDEIANLLESMSIMNYMVEIGGEIRTGGTKYGAPWKIAIEVPENGRNIYSVIKLESGALATSGDYRNYRENNGKRLSHIINPTTGYPISHRLASVSVVAETSAESDAWATAFMVLGETEGLKIAKQENLKVFMIVRDDGKFKSIMTDGFKPYLLGIGK